MRRASLSLPAVVLLLIALVVLRSPDMAEPALAQTIRDKIKAKIMEKVKEQTEQVKPAPDTLTKTKSALAALKESRAELADAKNELVPNRQATLKLMDHMIAEMEKVINSKP